MVHIVYHSLYCTLHVGSILKQSNTRMLVSRLELFEKSSQVDYLVYHSLYYSLHTDLVLNQSNTRMLVLCLEDQPFTVRTVSEQLPSALGSSSKTVKYINVSVMLKCVYSGGFQGFVSLRGDQLSRRGANFRRRLSFEIFECQNKIVIYESATRPARRPLI